MNLDGLDYPVRIRLRVTDIYDMAARKEELEAIIEYLDDLTGWQPFMYEIKYLSAPGELDVCFKEAQHAVMFALRWS
mgnify:FL=1